MSKNKGGRLKVNPDYDPVAARDKMAKAVAELYLHPSSNMDTDEEGHATMKELQDHFGLTMTKIRKLLVTAGVYQFYKDGVDMVEAVQRLHNEGKSLEEIKTTLHISTGTANSFLPYKSGTYNADFTADDYDFSNVSVDARRKRNQRKREKMKDSVNLEKRKEEITTMEDKRTFMDRYNEQKKKEQADDRKEARKWLEERGLTEQWDLYRKVVDGVKNGTLKITDIPGVKENMPPERIKEIEKDAVPFILQYVLHMQEYCEPDDEEQEPDVDVAGESFASSRYVHGKPIGDYVFQPRRGEYYRDESGRVEDRVAIIEAREDMKGMIGVVDENKCPHMFILQWSDYGKNISVNTHEVYKCKKNGEAYAGQPESEFEISVMGPKEEKERLIHDAIEKTVVTLQNLTVRREKSRGLDPERQLVEDGYYYAAKEVGSIEILDDYDGEVYFQIDGKLQWALCQDQEARYLS